MSEILPLEKTVPARSNKGLAPNPSDFKRKRYHCEPKNAIEKLTKKSILKKIGKDEKGRMKRRNAKEDLFNINNMVSNDIKHTSKECEGGALEKKVVLVLVPELKILGFEFYTEDNFPEDGLVEDDSDGKYEKMHKDFEIAEICSKFTKEGEVMPQSMKDGLKVRILLPKTSNELPQLLGQA
eukprot:TRINITY_DN1266_c0_g1_i2.p2 TRINITY_DN1266_c0_g1~~TRINITY_DN1266_c0_g1_i2.p2  ORF type:complete len:182 (-),score=40.48 TRINITY_DN1266_c0_g1_i2:33-578(-)